MSPRHETGSARAPSEEPPVAAATEIAAAARATMASRPSWESRLGEGVERKVPKVGDRLDEPCGGGDHRRVVCAELERRLRGVGKGGSKLGVRGDAADDRDPLGTCRLCRLPRPLDEGADDRPLVGRGEVGAPPLCLLFAQVANGVEERRLQSREGEVTGPSPARPIANGKRRPLPRARCGR